MPATNFAAPREGFADYVARMSGKEVRTLDLSSVAKVSIAPGTPAASDSNKSTADSTKPEDEPKQA